MVASPPSLSPSPAQGFASVLALLQPHMSALNVFLREQLSAFEPEIREMADYCIDTSGKRIRPTLVFLSGWRGDGAVDPEAVRLAAVIEMVHLATLVHDDIMDEADLRRGRPTAARQYGSEAAVLLGDALFSHALNLATQFPTTEICRAVSESMRKVCAGEIVQTLRRRSAAISRREYERIIDLKTAELFRVSCQLGSRLAELPDAYVDASARFGRHLGIAYQIYDDLADFFGEEKQIGKTLGTDLASGKVTLPLLVLLERLAPSEQADLRMEIQGSRPPQLPLRIRQMLEHGVFAAVGEAVQAQLEAAEAALQAWGEQPPTPLLLRFVHVLREQVAGLQGAR